MRCSRPAGCGRRQRGRPKPQAGQRLRQKRAVATRARASTLRAMALESRRGLLAIGVMKLFKGLGLLVLGIGVLSLQHRDAEGTVRQWIEFLRVDSHGRLVDHLLENVAGISPR